MTFSYPSKYLQIDDERKEKVECYITNESTLYFLIDCDNKLVFVIVDNALAGHIEFTQQQLQFCYFFIAVNNTHTTLNFRQ